MKKKFREITVDGVDYAWKVNVTDDGKYIKIWKDKKVIYEEMVNSEIDITPQTIKELVQGLGL